MSGGQGAVRLTAGEREVLSAAEPSLAIGERSRLMRAIEAIVAARVASALDEVADRWQQGEWANAPRYPDRVQERVANAQYVTDWLREQAAAPVPPADETEPQAGASGDGGGL